MPHQQPHPIGAGYPVKAQSQTRILDARTTASLHNCTRHRSWARGHFFAAPPSPLLRSLAIFFTASKAASNCTTQPQRRANSHVFPHETNLWNNPYGLTGRNPNPGAASTTAVQKYGKCGKSRKKGEPAPVACAPSPAPASQSWGSPSQSALGTCNRKRAHRASETETVVRTCERRDRHWSRHGQLSPPNTGGHHAPLANDDAPHAAPQTHCH